MKTTPTRTALWTLAAAAALALASPARAGGDAAAGKKTYDADCAKCHGATGDGKGRAGRSLEKKPTAFNDPAWKAKADDARLFKAIREGGKAVGQSGEMEAYPKYTDQQVNDVIAYLKTLAK